jgi:type II secretion system protein H
LKFSGESNRRPASRGFTLVELLLVLTVLAVMAGATIVSLRGRTPQAELRLAAGDLQASIRYAATEANSQGVPHRVRLDPRQGVFVVEVVDDLAESGFSPARGRPGRARTLARGVRVSLDPPPAAAEDGSYLLEVDGREGGFAGTVIVANDAGVVRIETTPRIGQVRALK